MQTTRTSAAKRATRWSVIAAVACVVWPITIAGAPPVAYDLADLRALEDAFVRLAEDVQPSVVAIRAYARHGRRGGVTRVRMGINQGSGVIFDSDGYILTNSHVVENAGAISVTLHNGLTFHDVRLVQNDVRSDLAVLKIDVPNLAAAPWGDGSKLKVNQWAFACGNPFGLANHSGRPSVTYGVISSLERDLTNRIKDESDPLAGRRYYGHLIETSAAINPGSSGGPLFDIDGKVVGIVAAIETSSGVNEGHGFAIPIDRFSLRIVDQLKTGNPVRYGFLGVSVEDVSHSRLSGVAELHAARGALIADIRFKEGPAAQAGLQVNDLVVEFDGVPVKDSGHLIRLVGFTPVGLQTEVAYVRNGVRRKTKVTLADRAELMGYEDRADETSGPREP